MEEGRSAFKILTEGLGVDGNTILEWILNRYQYEELGFFGSGQVLMESP